MAIQSINPASGEPIAVYPETPTAEIQACLEQAQAAFATWRNAGWRERGEKMKTAARILRRLRSVLQHNLRGRRTV